MKAAGIVGVIIQAITGNDGKSYTQQQLSMCARNELMVAGYVWCFPGGAKLSTTSRLSMFNGHTLDHLWLDVEQSGLKQSDVDRDLSLCDQYVGQLTGIYSGRWFFVQQGWLGLTRWSNRPLWDSNYDHVPVTAANFHPYGGWTAPVVKQFAGTSSIGSVHQLDLDVMG